MEVKLQDILAIERLSYANPWTARDFRVVLGQPECEVGVSFHGHRMVGFLISYANANGQGYCLANMAVHPKYRRRGYGTGLVEDLKKRRSGRIITGLGSDQVDALHFLQGLEFRQCDRCNCEEGCNVLILEFIPTLVSATKHREHLSL